VVLVFGLMVGFGFCGVGELVGVGDEVGVVVFVGVFGG